MIEFSRPFPLDTIGTAPRTVEIDASEAECAALAARFDLIGIESLSASASICRTAIGFAAQGQMEARATQRCVATGAPVEAKLAEPFTIRFLAESEEGEGEEIELDSEDCDSMTHDGRVIDLGEAVAQTLALALDPFPRAPDADATLAKAGVIREEDHATGAFAGLKGLFGKG